MLRSQVSDSGDCVKKKVIDKLFVNEVLSKEVNPDDS